MIPGERSSIPFIIPLLGGTVLFILVPAIVTFGLSFFRYGFTSPPQWIGIGNYTAILGLDGYSQDSMFWNATLNTLVLSLVIPFQVSGSLILAILLEGRQLGRRLLRLLVFFPSLTCPVAIYISWQMILNPDTGPVAGLFKMLGADLPFLLNDPTWAKPSLMAVIFWGNVGGVQMLFFLSGLRQIPQQLHDMAYLDGAGFRYRIASVYWPWLRKLTGLNLCIGFLGAIQGGFEIAYIMTGGGPLRSTVTLSYYLFENTFHWQQAGYGAAIGTAMFILSLPLLPAAWLLGRKK